MVGGTAQTAAWNDLCLASFVPRIRAAGASGDFLILEYQKSSAARSPHCAGGAGVGGRTQHLGRTVFECASPQHRRWHSGR